MTGTVGSAVAVDRSLGIKLVEALLIGCYTTIAPDLLALQIQSWTVSIEAVTIIVKARVSVLLVYIRRTLTRLAGTHFR